MRIAKFPDKTFPYTVACKVKAVEFSVTAVWSGICCDILIHTHTQKKHAIPTGLLNLQA